MLSWDKKGKTKQACLSPLSKYMCVCLLKWTQLLMIYLNTTTSRVFFSLTFFSLSLFFSFSFSFFFFSFNLLETSSSIFSNESKIYDFRRTKKMNDQWLSYPRDFVSNKVTPRSIGYKNNLSNYGKKKIA